MSTAPDDAQALVSQEASSQETGEIDEKDSHEPSQGGTETDQLPSAYYVTLQPLTLELCAQQFDRLNLRYSQEAGALSVRWETVQLILRIQPNGVLYSRFSLINAFSNASYSAVAARCSWWNLNRMLVKASAYSFIAQIEAQDDEQPTKQAIAVGVYLDHEVPFDAGVAPVQLQALFRALVKSVSEFLNDAKLDKIVGAAAW